ncbi:unnamed protein product [Ilex paraguariensis]|uniref:Thioredoxin domain-containing protein n=1 Tax=Ilex paraguariensis TaxID=185542 RepID=A0ABC8R6W4_9AQUA
MILEDSVHDPEPTLPANKPSVLLFIDRSSDSLEIRRKSKEALDALRELELHYNQMTGQNIAGPEKSMAESYQASKSTYGHPRRELSPIPPNQITLKDKMSVMVLNDGKYVTVEQLASDLQGSSLHEILAYVLKHKKEIKFSSLAKGAGFQLLSNDFDVKIAEGFTAQTEVQSYKASAEELIEGLLRGSVNLEKDQISHMAGIFETEHEEESKPTDTGLSQQGDEKTFADIRPQLSVEPDSHHKNKVVYGAEDGEVEQKMLSEEEKVEQQLHSKGFRISFFFFDGQYWLHEALTSGSKIPSMVIIDPISQLHYVLPEEAEFSFSSLHDFIGRFFNGSLLPCQRSESVVLSPKEAPSPPFVNLDFHEVDSIPRVTINTFSKLVIGNKSDSAKAGPAWEKDVLVLFSNSWCGFCQRMELVVREVHKAIRGYANMLKTGRKNEKPLLSSGK